MRFFRPREKITALGIRHATWESASNKPVSDVSETINELKLGKVDEIGVEASHLRAGTSKRFKLKRRIDEGVGRFFPALMLRAKRNGIKVHRLEDGYESEGLIRLEGFLYNACSEDIGNIDEWNRFVE